MTSWKARYEALAGAVAAERQARRSGVGRREAYASVSAALADPEPEPEPEPVFDAEAGVTDDEGESS